MNSAYFQVGGSLSADVPSYVERSADQELTNNVKNGQFSYVLTSRQMGKSSLKVRCIEKLKRENYHCLSLDMTRYGSANSQESQWYNGIMFDLYKNVVPRTEAFDNYRIQFRNWHSQYKDFTSPRKLIALIEDHLITLDKSVIIFLDEIDFLMTLNNFSSDDFFATIRYCYNQRSENGLYNKINFAIFGVAAPWELISDPTRTPFNIGLPVTLHNFSEDDLTPLLNGLRKHSSNSKQLLKEVLAWTGGQPFLTQSICAAIIKENLAKEGTENIVYDHIVNRYLEKSVSENHQSIANIESRIIRNTDYRNKMLEMYSDILEGNVIEYDKQSKAQRYLSLSGIVKNENGLLKTNNKIYAKIFDKKWCNEAIGSIYRPYAESVNRWVSSGRDTDALLKGNILDNALKWAAKRNGLTEKEKSFFEESKIAQAKDDAVSNKQKQLRIAIGVISMLFLLSLGLLAYSVSNSRKIDRQNQEIQDKNNRLLSSIIGLADAESSKLIEQSKDFKDQGKFEESFTQAKNAKEAILFYESTLNNDNEAVGNAFASTFQDSLRRHKNEIDAILSDSTYILEIHEKYNRLIAIAEKAEAQNKYLDAFNKYKEAQELIFTKIISSKLSQVKFNGISYYKSEIESHKQAETSYDLKMVKGYEKLISKLNNN